MEEALNQGYVTTPKEEALASLVPRPKEEEEEEEEEEEKGSGFSRSRMCLIISDLTMC